MQRRHWLINMLMAPWGWGTATQVASQPAMDVPCSPIPGHSFLPSCTEWPKGMEGQRKADLGQGQYLNPVLSGDHPDPTVLKDGDDYYMTHSSSVRFI